MSNDPFTLSDDDCEEIAPGVVKRVGDCTRAELESAVALHEEKRRLIDEIADLKRLSAERNLTLPRSRQRTLARLEDRALKRNRVDDIRHVRDVFWTVVNGGAQ